MPEQGGLKPELIDDFLERVDRLYDRLGKLQERLDNLEKREIDISLSDNAKGTARALDELSRAFKRFANATEGDILTAALSVKRFVTEMNSAVSSIPGDNYDDMRKAFRAVRDAMTTLQEVAKSNDISDKGLKATGDTIQRTFLPMIQTLEKLVKSSEGISTQRIKSLVKLVEEFGVVFIAFGDISTSVGKITSGAGPGKFREAIQTLTPIFNMITTVISASRGLTPQKLAQVQDIILGIGVLFELFEKMIPSLIASGNSVKLGDINNLSRILKEMSKIFEVIGALSRANVSPALINAATDLLKFTGDFVQILERISGRFGGFPWGQLRRPLRAFRRIMDTLAGALREIATIANATKPGTLAGAAEVLKAVSDFIDPFIKVGNTFNRFPFLGSPKLRKSAANLRDVINKGFVPMLKSLAGIDVNPAAISSAAQVFDAVRKILPDLRRMNDDFPRNLFGSGELRKATKSLRVVFLDGFLPTLKRLASASRGVQPEAIDAFVRVIDRIFKTFREIRSGAIDETVIKSIKNLGDALGRLKLSGKSVKELGSLATTMGSFTAVEGDSIKGLAALFDVLERIDFQKLSNIDLGNLAREIERLLRVLRRATGKELKALGDTLSSKKLGSVSSGLRLAEEGAKSFEEAIRRGTRKALRDMLLLKIALEAVTFVFRKIFEGGKQAFDTVAPNNFSQALEGTLSKLKDIAEGLRDVGEQIREAGSNIVETFGIQNILSSQAFESAVDFDKTGTLLQVFGGLTDEARESAEAFAFEIGKQYPLSANEALAATLDLIKAGQDLSSIEFILPAAADLSALSDTGDLENITGILIASAGVFNNFRNAGDGVDAVAGSFENIALATDLIAAAADVSTASVESLGEGLSNAGPAASAFGLSLEETAAILAIFNDAGLQGAEGGTALRSLLNALERPATQQALELLNISLFDAEGNRRPINEIMNDINRELDAMDPEERARTLQTLADTFGRQGLNILLAAGEDAISNTVDAMREIDPAAERAAQALDNFQGDVTQLKGSFETLLTAALVPTLERFFRPVVKLLRLVVDGFLSLDRSVIAFISSAVVLSSLFATIIGGILIFVGSMIQLGGIVFTVGLFMTNFLAVVGALVAGIAAFVTGLIAAVALFSVIVPVILGVTAAFETLFKIFQTDAGGATTAVQEFIAEVSKLFSEVAGLFSAFFRLLGGMTRTAQGSTNILDRIGAGIANFFNSLTESMRRTDSFIGGFRQNIRQLQGVFGAFNLIRQFIFDTFALRQRFNTGELGEIEFYGQLREQSDKFVKTLEILSRGNALLGSIIDRFRTDGQSFRDALFSFIDAVDNANLTNELNLIGDNFAQFLGDIGEIGFGKAFSNLISNLDTSLGYLASEVTYLLSIVFGGAFDDLFQIFQTEGLSGGLQVLIDNIVGGLRQLISDNRDVFKSVLIFLFNTFLNPLNSLRFISNLLGLDSLTQLLDGLTDFLERILGGVFDVVFNLIEGQPIGEALINAFGGNIEPLVNLGRTISDVISTIVEGIQGLFQTLFASDSETAGEGFFGFINDILSAISSFLDELNRLILEPLTQGDFTGVLNNLISVFIGFFESLWQSIVDAISIFDGDSTFSDLVAVILTTIKELIVDGVNAISNFTGIDLNDTLTALGTALEATANALAEGGVVGFLAGFVNAVIGLITSTLVLGLETIGELTGIDVSAPVTSLLTSLASILENNVAAAERGGAEGVFSGLATTIVGLIAGAIDAAVATLGSLLNIDTTAIQTDLQEKFGGLITAFQGLFGVGEDDVSIFDSISTVVTRLVENIGALFELLSGDTAPEESQINVLGIVVNAIINLVTGLTGLAVDTLTLVVSAIDGFFEALASEDPNTLQQLGLALGPIIAAFGAFQLVTSAAFAAKLLSMAGGLQSLFTALRPFLGLISVALVFITLAQNLDEFAAALERLLSGDFSGGLRELASAIGDAFLDLGINAIELLGFDVDEQEILNTMNRIGVLIELSLRSAGNWIQTNLIDPLDLLGLRAINVLDQSTIDRTLGIFDQEDVFQGLQATGGDIDVGVLSLGLRQNADEVFGQFREQFGANLDQFGEAFAGPFATQMRQMFNGLRNAGILDDFFVDLFATGDFDLANAVLGDIAINPESFAQVSEALSLSLRAGLIDSAQFTEILGTILQMNPELEASILTFASEFGFTLQDGVFVAIDSLPPTEVNLDVQAQTETTVDEEAVQQETSDRVRNTIEDMPPVEPSVSVSPQTTFAEDDAEGEGFGGIENTEDIAATNTEIDALLTRIGLLRTDLDSILPSIQTAVTELTILSETATGVSTGAEVASVAITNLNLQLTGTNTTLLLMLLNLGLMIPSFAALIAQAVLFGTLGALSVQKVTTSVTKLKNELVHALEIMRQGFLIVQKAANDLALTLSNVLKRANDIAGTINDATATAQGGGGSGSSENRAQGGTTLEGGLYEVTEGGSEVYYENGKMYLLSAGRGRVGRLSQALPEVNLSNSAIGGTIPATSNVSTNTTNSNTMSIDVGGANVQVTVNGANQDPASIAQLVAQEVNTVMQENNQNVVDSLRDNHR